MDRHLSPQEVASRFGVSIKALRLYEQRGLLMPKRSEAGWRTYGPGQIARLHQIITLKRLGLPLARIGELLLGRDDLDAVLALQEQVLSRQSRSVAQALTLLRSARAKLASGQALSIDDLANLNKETVMSSITDEERRELLKAIPARHFSAEEIETLKQPFPVHAAAKAQWDGLMAELKGLHAAKADPTSRPMQDLAQRWNTVVEKFTGGDPVLREKIRAVWKEAMADARTAPAVPITPELWGYIGDALRHLKASKVA